MNRETSDRLLRDKGLRSTPARRSVLSAMYGSGPVREEEIAARVGSECPDQATVYRTLSKLVDAGLVRRHRFHNRVWYFSLNIPEATECTHAHFVCEECGQCECLDTTSVPDLPPSIGNKLVTGVEVVVNGICGHCRSGKARNHDQRRKA